MPQVDVDGLTINYDVQGEGEPLLLIAYLSADHACYAFQLPAYTERFSCIALDLRLAGHPRLGEHSPGRCSGCACTPELGDASCLDAQDLDELARVVA